MQGIASVVIILLQLGIGKLIKMNPKLANGIIFYVNWAIGIIANALTPYLTATPAHASTGSTITSIGSFIFSNPFILGFIQSLFATGFHSTVKNTAEALGIFKKVQ